INIDAYYYGNDAQAGLLVDGADQAGGRVYAYGMLVTGINSGAGLVLDTAYDINDVSQTVVSIEASEFGEFLSGVGGTGGPGKVQYLTGGSAAAQRLFDVENNGAVIGAGIFFDWGGGTSYPWTDSLVDLTSSGNVALVAMQWQVGTAYPTIQTKSFQGTLTVLDSGNGDNIGSSPFFSLTGDGTQTNVLSAGNLEVSSIDSAAFVAENQTSPTGQISQIFNRSLGGHALPDVTNTIAGAWP